MRLMTLLLALALAACAKKPAPQSPQPKSNTAGTTEAAPAESGTPAPAGDESHSRGPTPKGGAGKTGGDPCEGGQ